MVYMRKTFLTMLLFTSALFMAPSKKRSRVHEMEFAFASGKGYQVISINNLTVNA